MPYIEHYGTEAQKNKFLPKVCRHHCLLYIIAAAMLMP
jgi:hypothetical protein